MAACSELLPAGDQEKLLNILGTGDNDKMDYDMFRERVTDILAQKNPVEDPEGLVSFDSSLKEMDRISGLSSSPPLEDDKSDVIDKGFRR